MIKAIETVYNGYRFRSRLEARWAVFFDTLGIKYEYEKEGYDLDGVLYMPNAANWTDGKVPHKGIWYLPDFWLPKQDCWIEIKGQEPTDEEIAKMSALTALTGKAGYILWGNIPGDADEAYQEYNWVEYRDGEYYDSFREWTACRYCDCVDLVYSHYGKYLPCGCTDDKGSNTDRINAAYTAARQARFEHGKREIIPKKEIIRPKPNPRCEQYQAGDRVRHDKFGEGVILKSEMEEDTEFVDVLFQGKRGLKRLSMDFAKLVCVDDWNQIEREAPSLDEVFPPDWEDIPDWKGGLDEV